MKAVLDKPLKDFEETTETWLNSDHIVNLSPAATFRRRTSTNNGLLFHRRFVSASALRHDINQVCGKIS